MKKSLKKSVAMLFAVLMLLGVLPLALHIPTVEAATIYGKSTKTGVKVRKKADSAADYWFKIDMDYVCVVKAETDKGGYHWFKVEVIHPDPNSTKAYTGFIRGDCFRLLTNEETDAFLKAGGLKTQSEAMDSATAAPSSPASSNVTAGSGAMGKITNGEVNFRETEGGRSMMKLERGTVVEILSIPVVIDTDHWYKVRYDGRTGYIQAPYLAVVSMGTDNGQETGNSTGTAVTPSVTKGPTSVTAEPSKYGYVRLILSSAHLRETPAGKIYDEWEKTGEVLPIAGASVKKNNYEWYPVKWRNRVCYVRNDCIQLQSTTDIASAVTPAPVPTATPEPESVVGYIKVISGGSNLRLKPAGTVIKQIKKNTICAMLREPVTEGKYQWYYVNADGDKGYLRGDVVKRVNADGSKLATPVPESTPVQTAVTATSTPDSGKSGYLITTLDKVNLRAAAGKDATAKYNVAIGTVMAYETTAKSSGSIWYRVVYNNTKVWVLGTCIRILSNDEYQNYISTQPEATPQANVVLGYVKTTAGGTNLRTKANGTNIIGRSERNVVMSYDEEPTVIKNVTWYHVKHPILGYGYIHGNYVSLCDQNGDPLPTAAPYIPGDNEETAPEATYNKLMLGSKGDDVKKLVQALINQGFYKKSVTSTYTTAVKTAVENFQKAKGLTVDGIAGPATQHALFGTVPAGTNSGSSGTNTGTMMIYAAEKIDWYTGGIQQLWPKGANFQIYDVKTGITWWAHRWSGGFHCDAEPLTAADTAKLCKAYGVSTADQIASKNLWQRRPCLVTIGNRTFACSLYGVPHNYPEGDTISNNDFKGQLCIHFTNSKTHAGNQVDKYHTEAIQYAWEHAPNGHK